MQLNSAHNRQRGLTLIEILIGMAVGVVVVGGAIVMYASSVQNSNGMLKSSKLNQELGGLMHVITNDLRRVGFWGDVNSNQYHLNPFNQVGATALVVIDDMNSNTVQAATGQGSCVVYAYDATYLPANAAGVVESTDLFGFRLNGSVVQMRQTGVVDGTECVGGTCNSCTNGNWENVTDPILIDVTALTFDLVNSQCLNASEPNGVDDNGDGTIDEDGEYDCYVTIPPVGSGEATVETREVLVSVTGQLAGDSLVQVTTSQTIRVRNDLLRIR
jgi:prepilin peptidase dependent protein B